MRTDEEVKKFLAKDYLLTHSGVVCTLHCYDKNSGSNFIESVQFNRFDDAINECLIKLWNNEEIVDAIALNENLSLKKPNLIFLTNQCRLFICKEESSTSQGLIFTSTNYHNKIEVIELKKVDLNKCRILEIKNESFFGKPKPSVNGDLIINDERKLTIVKLVLLDKIYEAIENNIKAYAEKPALNAQENNVDTANSSSAAAKCANVGSAADSKNSGNVAEIRKLYEDGIITREEMLDLIKCAVSK